jgi:hypothetical protein
MRIVAFWMVAAVVAVCWSALFWACVFNVGV